MVCKIDQGLKGGLGGLLVPHSAWSVTVPDCLLKRCLLPAPSISRSKLSGVSLNRDSGNFSFFPACTNYYNNAFHNSWRVCQSQALKLSNMQMHAFHLSCQLVCQPKSWFLRRSRKPSQKHYAIDERWCWINLLQETSF